MNKSLYFIIISAIFILSTNSGMATPKTTAISLDQNQFWIKKGFAIQYKDLQKNELKDWQTKTAVPITFKSIVPKSDHKISEYTYITFFDIPHFRSLPQQKNLGFFLPIIGENWEIFINGHLIAKEIYQQPDGSLSIKRTVRDHIVQFSPSIVKEKNNQLTIRILGEHNYNMSGLFNSIGYQIEIYDVLLEKKSEMIALVLIFLYFFVGLYHIFLYVKRPQEKYNLFFGVFASELFVYLFTRSNTVFKIFLDTEFIVRVEYISLFTLFIFLLLFIDYLIFNQISIHVKIYTAFAGILSFLMLFVSLPVSDIVLVVWQTSMLYVLTIIIISLIRGIRRKIPEAKSLMAGIIITALTASFDIFDSLFFQTGLAFSKYSFFIFVMGIATILANRFLRVHTQVEELNKNLEIKVEERTRELQETLNKVQTLKIQQDGDYFLTSLLIKPLGKTVTKSDNIVLESFAKQKKQFKFRNREAEIGGDINIANTITLKDREFTVFLNGDAMGKSIQGAGGALVLGVVFNSYITRTKLSQMYQNRHPEQWLKGCFRDLQYVFETFDGTMLASLVMGLVDNESGILYFINAEHPWTVLYRNQKAIFIEKELFMHKIGTTFNNERPFQVHIFPLRHEDVVIMGSDGRDDIQLGEDENGNRIINEDENLFLQNVEKSNGQLEKIIQLIEKTGDLTDDVTLLRLSFFKPNFDSNLHTSKRLKPRIRKEFIEAQKMYTEGEIIESINKFNSLLKDKEAKQNSCVLRFLGKAYIKNKNFSDAANCFAKASHYNPKENELLFLAAYAYKMAYDYSSAADYGERLRIRDPRNSRNLFNLADTYRLMENFPRALRILNQALAIDPNNKNGEKLQNMLKTINMPEPISE